MQRFIEEELSMEKIDFELLEQIADLHKIPEGAYNIRKNGASEGRNSTESISITTSEKGGLKIEIKDGTKNQSVHIPVIISKSGLKEMVYNDFYVGEDCDVLIVAGCGISNCGKEDSRHDGVHTFYIGKNSKVKYVEKHYGTGDGEGGRVMNPKTVVYLEEGAKIEMDTTQIRGIDDTIRETVIHQKKDSESLITERLLTHDKQRAESKMNVYLEGNNSRARIISRSVAKGGSRQVFYPCMTGKSSCFGHVQCDSIIMDEAVISSIPAISAENVNAQLVHEAAIGKIAGEQILKLQTFGLTAEEAEEQILKGFLK